MWFAARLPRLDISENLSTLDWDFSVEIPKLEEYDLFFKPQFMHLERMCVCV